MCKRYFLSRIRLIHYRSFNISIDCTFVGFFLKIRCLDLSSVQIHVNGIRNRQIYTSVNTASGIPAAGRSLMIDFYGNHVFFADIYIIGNVK